MKTFLLFLFITLTQLSIGQTLDGIWFGEYVLDIDSIEYEYIEELDSVYLQNGQNKSIDSTYISSNLICRIKNDSISFLLSDGFSSPSNLIKNEDSLLFQFDDTQFYIIVTDSNLIMGNKAEKNKSSFVFLYRLNPIPKEEIKIESELDLQNSIWKSTADTSSINYGLKLHFLDSAEVLVTKIYKSGEYGHTHLNDFGIIKIDNFVFLWIYDIYWISLKTFRIYKNPPNQYFVQSFEDHSKGEHPLVKTNFMFQKLKELTIDERNKIKNNLVGSWHLNNSSIPIDPILSSSDTLINQYFNIRFNIDNTYDVKYGGVVIDESRQKNVSVEYKGKWEVGKSGSYLITKHKIKDEFFSVDKHNVLSTNYITIIDLDESQLIISLDLRDVESRIQVYGDVLLKLRKE